MSFSPPGARADSSPLAELLARVFLLQHPSRFSDDVSLLPPIDPDDPFPPYNSDAEL